MQNSKLQFKIQNFGLFKFFRKTFNFELLTFNLRLGQTLIEVIVALGVVVLLALSLITTSLVTQRSARSARNNTVATKLVEENIEQMRVVRDRQGFSVLGDGACWVLTNTGDVNPANWKLEKAPAVTCPEIKNVNNTNFNRSVRIDPDVNVNKKKITVIVTWIESGGTQVVSNVTYLSNCVISGSLC